MSEIGTNRWQEARETLTELVEWLDDARLWAEAAAPSNEPIDEEVCQAAQAFESPEPPARPTERHSLPDMFAVVAELTALRHEVKLQTRAARQDRELATKAFDELSNAVRLFAQWQTDETARRETAVAQARRDTADLLVDLHDAMSRSFTEANRVVRSAVEELHCATTADLEDTGFTPIPPPPTLLHAARGEESSSGDGIERRAHRSLAQQIFYKAGTLLGRLRGWWLGAGGQSDQQTAHRPIATWNGTVQGAESRRGKLTGDNVASIARRIEGVTDGYALTLRRIERALAEFEIEPIEAVGQAVDPELMEVVQSATDPALPPGIVVAEVRRGYRRHHRVMRFAQVVVNRPAGMSQAAATGSLHIRTEGTKPPIGEELELRSGEGKAAAQPITINSSPPVSEEEVKG